MPSPIIKSQIEGAINQYSQQMDLVQGPQVRHQLATFLDETKDLSDNEFLRAANEKYGFILEHLHKRQISSYLNTIKLIMIIFIVIPAILWVGYLLITFKGKF